MPCYDHRTDYKRHVTNIDRTELGPLEEREDKLKRALSKLFRALNTSYYDVETFLDKAVKNGKCPHLKSLYADLGEAYAL